MCRRYVCTCQIWRCDHIQWWDSGWCRWRYVTQLQWSDSVKFCQIFCRFGRCLMLVCGAGISSLFDLMSGFYMVLLGPCLLFSGTKVMPVSVNYSTRVKTRKRCLDTPFLRSFFINTALELSLIFNLVSELCDGCALSDAISKRTGCVNFSGESTLFSKIRWLRSSLTVGKILIPLFKN